MLTQHKYALSTAKVPVAMAYQVEVAPNFTPVRAENF